MWMTAYRIAGAVLLSFVVCLGVASAQYTYPPATQPTPPPSQAVVLNAAKVTIEGKPQTILVDGKGMSLYYLTSDTLTSSACTERCAAAWPPLLSTNVPAPPASVTGKLAIVKTTNGSQVSYNGHLLYRFGVDSKPGEVQGEGRSGPQNGVWHVATPDVKPATT